MRKGKKGLAGIVVVSHSNKLAEEVINFSKVLQQTEFNIENGGNVNQEVYGTNVEKIKEAVKELIAETEFLFL